MSKEIAEAFDQDDDQQGMYLTFELANESLISGGGLFR
jgi:hypothetical protein